MMVNKKLLQKLVPFKIYVERAVSYISILNSGMIMVVFIRTVRPETTVWQMIPVYLLTICMLVGLGFIDVKLGLLKEEFNTYWEQNPQIQEMKSMMKEINEKLDKTEVQNGRV